MVSLAQVGIIVLISFAFGLIIGSIAAKKEAEDKFARYKRWRDHKASLFFSDLDEPMKIEDVQE